MPLTDKDIQVLSREYPWPSERPEFSPANWSLDGGGKDLVIKRIDHDNHFLVLEIGVFLGSSLKQWLVVSPDVYVIAIDPWAGEWWTDYAQDHGRNSLAQQFSRQDGPYLTFLSSLWEFRDRLFPVRGTSPEKLYELAQLGVEPDLVFFDSNKTGEDIEVVHQLFPRAILTGDDWTWGLEHGYPIRESVRAFADNHGFNIVFDRATWVLLNRPLKFTEIVTNLMSFARDIARAVRDFVS